MVIKKTEQRRKSEAATIKSGKRIGKTSPQSGTSAQSTFSQPKTSEKSVAPGAGMFKNDPYWDEYTQILDRYRKPEES